MMQYYRSKTTIESIIWYLVFGVLHELSHVAIATILLGPSLINSPFTTFDNLYCQFILRAVLGRCWEMTIDTDMPSTFAIHTIRHFGWIFSVVIAMVTYHVHRSRNNKFNSKNNCNKNCSPLNNPLVYAAALTAIESISTDLFGLENYLLPLFPTLGGGTNNSSIKTNTVTFYCGNFGLILLNPAYNATAKGCETALDILEKMISVTMVRGAQSGE